MTVVLPDIWGEGQLFAFSGLDGPTDVDSRWVARTGTEPFDLVLETPHQRVLRLRAPGTLAALTGDVLEAGPLRAAWSSWHTLIGEGGDWRLEADGAADGQSVAEDGTDAVVLVQRGNRRACAYGCTADEARARAAAGLQADLEAVIAARVAPYARLAPLADARRARLRAKCLSVMRVNHCGPEGVIPCRWSTSSRLPHRVMFLWDSVFHSRAIADLDPAAAADDLAAVFAFQKRDGMVPHYLVWDGRTSGWTQPPLLAWGVWDWYRRSGDRERLRWFLPRLRTYLAWDARHRAHPGDLLAWGLEEDAACRCGECGLDNSPRFDAAEPAANPDFTAEYIHDLEHLVLVGETLGEDMRAERAEVERRTAALHARLWHEEDGQYYDRAADGRWIRVPGVSGFLALLAPGMPPDRLDRLERLVRAPRFAPAWPLATVAADHPSFGIDMWRGPVWLATNMLVIRGFARHGRDETAHWLAERTLAMAQQWYERLGCLFEFYDATDRVPPPRLDRKGPADVLYSLRGKKQCIRDYHWTAAIAFRLLQDAG